MGEISYPAATVGAIISDQSSNCIRIGDRQENSVHSRLGRAANHWAALPKLAVMSDRLTTMLSYWLIFASPEGEPDVHSLKARSPSKNLLQSIIDKEFILSFFSHFGLSNLLLCLVQRFLPDISICGVLRWIR